MLYFDIYDLIVTYANVTTRRHLYRLNRKIYDYYKSKPIVPYNVYQCIIDCADFETQSNMIRSSKYLYDKYLAALPFKIEKKIFEDAEEDETDRILCITYTSNNVYMSIDIYESSASILKHTDNTYILRVLTPHIPYINICFTLPMFTLSHIKQMIISS